MRKEASFDDYLFAYTMLVSLLEKVIASDKIMLCLKTEQLMIEYDSEHFCQTPGSKKRQDTVLQQLEDIERLLKCRDAVPEQYDGISIDHLAKSDVRSGLPIDGVRNLIASHKTRTNREIASRSEGHSPEQLDYLRLRGALKRVVKYREQCFLYQRWIYNVQTFTKILKMR